MKNKLLLSLLVLAAFFAGSLVTRPSGAQSSEDDFTVNVLHHGVPFDHADCCGEENTDPRHILSASHFEPGAISLVGDAPLLSINNLSVVTVPAPANLMSIPEASGTNNTEVLNDIRAVLIDRGLAVAPE